MVVDCHQHPHDSVPEVMAEHGFDVSVLLPVGGEALARARKMAEEAPEKYVPFFWIDVSDIERSVGELEAAAGQWGCKGVKFQLLLQHLYANDRRLYPVYEKCSELGLAVTFHTGAVAFTREFAIPHRTKYAHPLPADDVAFDFPELRIILAHMGGNWHYEALIVAEKHENVFLDTAYLPFFCERMLPQVTAGQLIERALRVLGAERVLYAYEGLAPAAVRELDIPEGAKRLILGGNAARLFGL
ncbi:MAG: amidohydrolase family protein [Candidatus Brocadiia bacterium]